MRLALGYSAASIGPRYDICEHDWDFDMVVGWDHDGIPLLATLYDLGIEWVLEAGENLP